MFRLFFAASAAGILLCACATDPAARSEPREEREYRTGSNIPVRDRSAPSEVKTLDPAAVDYQRSMGTRTAPVK